MISNEPQEITASKILRETFKFLNPLTGTADPISLELGLLNDYDSVLFTTILKEYLVRFGAQGTASQVLSLAKKVIRDTGGTKRNIVSIRAGALKAEIGDDE